MIINLLSEVNLESGCCGKNTPKYRVRWAVPSSHKHNKSRVKILGKFKRKSFEIQKSCCSCTSFWIGSDLILRLVLHCVASRDKGSKVVRGQDFRSDPATACFSIRVFQFWNSVLSIGCIIWGCYQLASSHSEYTVYKKKLNKSEIALRVYKAPQCAKFFIEIGC